MAVLGSYRQITLDITALTVKKEEHVIVSALQVSSEDTSTCAHAVPACRWSFARCLARSRDQMLLLPVVRRVTRGIDEQPGISVLMGGLRIKFQQSSVVFQMGFLHERP